MISTSAFKTLVVDGNPDKRAAMVRLLRCEGYCAVEASSGAEGLCAASKERPDLMIVDVMLPDMDGVELCRCVQTNPELASISTILIPGIRTTSNDQHAGREFGVFEYIVRPIPSQELLARIKAVARARLESTSEHHSSNNANCTECRENLKLANEELLTEVHEQKRIQANLLKREEELLTIFASAPICIFMTDGDARLLRLNQTLADLVAQSPRDMLGKPCGTAFLCVHAFDDPDGCGFGPQCPLCDIRSTIRDVFQSGETQIHKEVKLTFQRGDNTDTRAFLISASAIEHSGNRNVLICMDDITERILCRDQLIASENSNRLLADLVRAASQPFGIGYTDGRLGLVNPAFCDLVGYSEDQLRQINWNVELTPEEWREMEVRKLHELSSTKEPVRYEKEYIHKDGYRIPVELLVHVRCDDEGHPMHFFAFVNDLRRSRQAEKSSEELRSQLYQAQKMEAVGQLAGGIAHDFNNLLSIILGNCEMTLDELDLDHPHYESLKEVFEASIRARNLTRQLLAFSRKQVLEMRLIDANDVVLGFEKLIRRMIGEDIDLNISLSETALPIRADTSQLEQVLMNLAVNARDAMPDGGTLSITTAYLKLDAPFLGNNPTVIPGDYAMISLQDTGCGMDDSTLDHLFEPFFTTKAQGHGTGLGLATCYGIIKQHGGYLKVTSEPGEGSTFTLFLKIEYLLEEEELVSDTPHQKSVDRMTILIVEDDPTLRKLVSRMCSANGYKVIAPDTVENAIVQARVFHRPIHLVISDVIMPTLNGPSVFAKIREYHPEAKVMYMSGYTDDVICKHGVLEKGVHFLHKPFTLNQLLRKITETLQS